MKIKNCFSMLMWLVVFNVVLRVKAEIKGRKLGDHCRHNLECNVASSHCEQGICTCDPYFARVDNSTCLESCPRRSPNTVPQPQWPWPESDQGRWSVYTAEICTDQTRVQVTLVWSGLRWRPSGTAFTPTLLGSECVVSEQCTLKVAYSACLDGVCRCTDGHLQFRKHTCLSPAPPGHVCYSNEHCRLWDKESHCEFVIPNLFGRCGCNSYYKQSGDKCVATKLPVYATEAVVAEPETIDIIPTSNIPKSKPISEEPNAILDEVEIQPSQLSPVYTIDNDKSAQEDNSLLQAVMKVPTEPVKRLPPTNRKDGEPNETITVDDMTANLHANDQPIYRVVTQPSIEKKGNKKKESSKPYKTGHQKKSSLKEKHRVRTDAVPDLGPASLGMNCVTDSQCQQVDKYTRCLNKRCDCAFRTNSTSACSARNRGCLPGTFQCRSTGACISWYFVCDGRKDCPDGSDEKCLGTGKEGTGERCPMHAFRCGGPGSPCVSRASRCDGTPQCPGGEDERNCHATRRKGCPRHTFRCNSGECLPEYEFCNAIVSCKDASDEPPHLCNEQSRWRAADFCPLRCGNGRCRSTAVACSGRDGCGDNSDEIACSVCKCPAPQQNQ